MVNHIKLNTIQIIRFYQGSRCKQEIKIWIIIIRIYFLKD